jgi:hypothetical protein
MVGAGRRRGQRLQVRRSAPTRWPVLTSARRFMVPGAFVPGSRLPPDAGTSLAAPLSSRRRCTLSVWRRVTPRPSIGSPRRPLRRLRREGRPRRLGHPGPKATRTCVPRGEIRGPLEGGAAACGLPRGRLRGWRLVERRRSARVAFGPRREPAGGGRAATSCPQGASRRGAEGLRAPRRHPAALPVSRGRAARSGATSPPAASVPAGRRRSALRSPRRRRARPPARAPSRCRPGRPRPPGRCPACRRRTRR